MVSDVGPIPQTVDLRAINEKQLLIGTPVVAKDGISMLLYDAIVVPCLVVSAFGTFKETAAAEIVGIEWTWVPRTGGARYSNSA